MPRYMEFVFIDSDGNARMTGVGAIFKNDAETTKAFESYKDLVVDIKEARFILDLHEYNGDIVDSISMSIRSFTEISNEGYLGEDHYIEYDKRYWINAWKGYKKSHQSRP